MKNPTQVLDRTPTMSIVNTRDKTINTKIVYYGPGLGGKTTSLNYVHQVLDPENMVKMVSLKTDEERTLFFDFVPIDLGMLGGYKVKIQGFTVPGQVKYNLTRKYVLMGADAVVFVADSDANRIEENLTSLANLAQNLKANGLEIENVPLVIQFNKRDLDTVMSMEEMAGALVTGETPHFATNARTGEGVFDAFVEASCRMIEAVGKKYQLESDQGCLSDLTRRSLMHYVATTS
jgi:signal recognition particle receptor subunit beta